MKVGTDAVLLGAWADVSNSKTILDIGTGSGVIALMLAQRMPLAQVDAVEIDEASAKQAEENFERSVFANRLRAYNSAIQDFEGKYDLIVSNPPFFSKSLLPPTSGRQIARHTTTLTHDDLLKAVVRLLDLAGIFAVIVPTEDIIKIAKHSGLYCNRKTSVIPRNKVERFLLEFSRTEKVSVEDELILHDGERRGDGYRKLTQEFYL